MSWLIFLILVKAVLNFNHLIVSESFLGWFLIEHLFEEYCLTANKFFLINDDFRNLIKNFGMIIKNIFLIIQPFNLIDILLLNVFVFILFFNRTRYNFYLCILIGIYFLNFYIIFYLFKQVLLTFLVFFSSIYCLKVLYWVFVFIDDIYVFKTILIKLSVCVLLINTFLILSIIMFYFFSISQENPIHENVIYSSFLYYYLYLKIL